MDLKRKLNQKATYWAADSIDGFGNKTFADAVEIDCHWDYVTTLFVDTNGKEERSISIVYTDQDLSIGGYLRFGTLSELDSTTLSDPTSLSDAWPIRNWGKTYNIQGTQFLAKAYL